MSKTMNNTLRVIVAVSICTGLYLAGIYIGDWTTDARVRAELSAERAEAMARAHHNDHRLAFQSEQIANAEAIQRRLDAIELALEQARTIHIQRGPDGVLHVSVIRTDGSAYEVSGRTLDVLIGGGNGQ